jgi:hypothetical protein
MTKTLGDSPKEDFPVPERVVLLPIDLDPSNECVRVVTMAFIRGTEPATTCGARRQSVPTVAPVTPPPTPASPGLTAPPPQSAIDDPAPSAMVRDTGPSVTPAPTTPSDESP